MAYRAGDCRLRLGSQEGETYNQIVKSWSNHPDGPFCDHRHPAIIVDYIYNFDNETQLKAGAGISIPPTIQAQCQAQAREGAYSLRRSKSSCKRRRTACRPPLLGARRLVSLQHHPCRNSPDPRIENNSRVQCRHLVVLASNPGINQRGPGCR